MCLCVFVHVYEYEFYMHSAIYGHGRFFCLWSTFNDYRDQYSRLR